MARTWIAFALLGVVACGGPAEPEDTTTTGGEVVIADGSNTNAPPPEQPPMEQQTTWPNRTGSGQSAEDPVSACGPADSYAFVAGEFQCPGGGNPLGGDPQAGAQSRQGNVGANSTGHIIDHYQVPCPSGPVDVYVDMYGCPEMDSAMREMQPQ